MKSASVLAVLVAVAPASATAANPLGKVLDLLGELTASVVADGEKADKAYNEFLEWCDDVDKTTRYEIKTAEASKEKFESSIAKLSADIEVANSKIEDLAASITEAEKELEGATAVRKKENEQFVAAEGELVGAVDTLDRAIGVLEREMAKSPAAFAQIDTSSLQRMLGGISAVIDAAALSGSDRERLLALAQSSSEADDDAAAPAPSAYKSHSGDIVGILGDMRDKASAELSELRQTEATAAHSFKMLRQSLERQIAAQAADLSEEKASKAADEQQKGADSSDLVVAKKQLAGAEQKLTNTHQECLSLAADHESSTVARAEELKVLAKATKLLKEETSGAVEKTYSFLQLSSGTQKRLKITSLIKRLAKEQHSSALAQLASRIGAVMQYSHGADGFAKVKGLIIDMIAKLEKEAAAEAKEKAYCDEEMAKTENKKSELQDDIDALTTKIDQAASRSAELKGDVKTLQAEMAALAKAQAGLDRIRNDENAAYTETKADLEKGLSGVQQALEALRTYYGAGAALLQSDSGFQAAMRQPAKPENHEKSSGAGGAIIGILEVVESDFSKNLAYVEQEEAGATAEYEQTTQENKITKTTKEQDVKYKTSEFKALDKAIKELVGDKETAATELASVEEYYGLLRGRCVVKARTYEEHQQRREAEIRGLKEALSILDHETAFVQRRSLRHSSLRAGR